MPIDDRGFSARNLNGSDTYRSNTYRNQVTNHESQNENSKRLWVAKMTDQGVGEEEGESEGESEGCTSELETENDEDMDHIPINLTDDFLGRNMNN